MDNTFGHDVLTLNSGGRLSVLVGAAGSAQREANELIFPDLHYWFLFVILPLSQLLGVISSLLFILILYHL